MNWLMTHAGLGHFTNTDWFGRSALLAFGVITLMIVWQAIPFVALTLHAGLTQVPEELYEAARVDGAGQWLTFRSITLPILILLGILSTIWDFTVFNQIWVMTHGGPNQATVTLGVWSYTEAFGASQFGRASAIALISVILLAGLTAFYIRRPVNAGGMA